MNPEVKAQYLSAVNDLQSKMNTGKITPDVFEKEVTKLRVQSMMEQELVDVTARKIGSYKETSPDEFMTV